MLHRLLIILLLISPARFCFAQDIPIGDWRDHLPYSDAISISYGNNIVYCATNSAVFMYDKSDMTVERLNLVNGLSDIGLSKIKYNDYNQRVIIAYANGNVDVIDERKNITNLSFIKNSNVIGSKAINHIYLQGKLAYLSTGFGIVVLDTDKLEIIDTYLFGPSGSFMFTNAVTMDTLNIYAATDQGVFYANKNSGNLVDYNVWTLLPDLGTLNYSNIVTYAGRVFASSESTAWNGDTIFNNDGGVWQKFITWGLNLNSLNVSGNSLIISSINQVKQINTSLATEKILTNHKSLFNLSPMETVMDDEGYMLIAEEDHGIIRAKDDWDSEVIVPNGPSSANVFTMDFLDNELWVVSGGFGLGISKNVFNHKSTDGNWELFNKTINNISGSPAIDMVSVAINPQNTNQVYIGSFSHGLFELNSGVVTTILTAQTSILDSTFFGSTAIATMKFDAENNFWVSSSFSNNILAVKAAADNNWYSFSFPGVTSSTEFFPKMIVDQNNYKWIISPEQNRILIFDDNNTIPDIGDDRVAINNNIPGSEIQCITEDLDGEIWIGTDEGVAVFYNPSAVFDENITAEQIFIQQDGQTQILLETEVVTVIKMDGANRKWIGTENSGVFLMSEDGTEQIEHFTTENSPLFSNSIFDIVINPTTGEVFFGTEKGLISYKGTATDADDDFNNVFVYPNPVKPDFTGTIAIRGLVKDTDVRITDISGNIVYQTTSLGGQAIWDGKDFNGNKVQTGVYMVFNGSPDGELKAAAKILFIH